MTDATDARLAVLLQESMVDWDVLQTRYGTMLQLVNKVLGVVPNCDRYLEIWPPAFRTYNILAPNLLNLPVPVLGVGGPPPAVVGLGMYVSSRTAGCPYCSAHTCSFAMRRGASREMVVAALTAEGRTLGAGELAAVAVARALAQVPSELTSAEKAALIAFYGEKKAEWIVLGIVMMGFLNKFMDGIGVELEQPVFDEVADTMGPNWSPGKNGREIDLRAPRQPTPPVDGWRTRLGLVKLIPSAIRYDGSVQRGVPKKPEAVSDFLSETFGHDFPVLATLHSNRARRSIASMLRENLDPATSVIGIEKKLQAGAIFAEVVSDQSLDRDLHGVARHFHVDLDRASLPDPTLAVARAVSPSPAAVDASTVEAARDGGLSPTAIVELVTWLAVLQMLHRLHGWASPPGRANA